MGLKDLLIAPLYLLIVYALAGMIKSRRYDRDDPTARYFMPALTLKIFGAIAFGLVYQFYYGGGDTFGYYAGGEAYLRFFMVNPGEAIYSLFAFSQQLEVELLNFADPQYRYIFRGASEQMMIKITGIFNLLALNSYASTSILFAFFSFLGLWALYRTFVKIFPGAYKQLAIACFFIPSVVFWGSGILKDTVTLACVGFLTYGCYYLFIRRRRLLPAFLLIGISVYFIANIKGYILIAFLPALLFWIIESNKQKLPTGFLRAAATPFTLLLIAGAGLLMIGQISEMLGRYSLENLESTAVGTQTWHTVASGAEGSGYTLGTVGFTPDMMLQNFPAAVNVTLFRPYLWEAGGVVSFASALESLAFLLITLWALFKTRVFGFFEEMGKGL